MSIYHQNSFLRYEISASRLLVTGALLLLAFILQTHITIRIAEVLLFLILARYSGKRIWYTYFLLFCAAIFLAQIFSPSGKVLWHWGKLVITQGSLSIALRRSVYLLGFLFISLFSIRSDLVLPGHWGAIIAKTLYYYDMFLAEKYIYRGNKLSSVLIHIFEKRYHMQQNPRHPVGALRTTKRGWFFLLTLEFIVWSLLLIP